VWFMYYKETCIEKNVGKIMKISLNECT